MKSLIRNSNTIVKIIALMVGSIVATLVVHRFLGQTAVHLLQAFVQAIQ